MYWNVNTCTNINYVHICTQNSKDTFAIKYVSRRHISIFYMRKIEVDEWAKQLNKPFLNLQGWYPLSPGDITSYYFSVIATLVLGALPSGSSEALKIFALGIVCSIVVESGFKIKCLPIINLNFNSTISLLHLSIIIIKQTHNFKQ